MLTGTTAHGKATAVLSIKISEETLSRGFRGVMVSKKGKHLGFCRNTYSTVVLSFIYMDYKVWITIIFLKVHEDFKMFPAVQLQCYSDLYVKTCHNLEITGHFLR